MNRIFQGTRFDIKALNLNKFYSDIQNELGIKKSSMLEMGVEERTHHKDKTRTVTTTQIAAGHEYGNSYTPPRPFLHTSANEFVNGSFQEDVKQDYVYLGAFLKRLAKKLYSTVVECFMSGGFGKWLPLTDEYRRRTGRTDPPLVDTGKLLSSVYVRYEGYTISGKNTGGIVSGDLGQEKDVSRKKKETKKPQKIRIWTPQAKNEQEAMMFKIAQEKQIQRMQYLNKYGSKKYLKDKEKLEQEFQEKAVRKLMGGK